MTEQAIVSNPSAREFDSQPSLNAWQDSPIRFAV